MVQVTFRQASTISSIYTALIKKNICWNVFVICAIGAIITMSHILEPVDYFPPEIKNIKTHSHVVLWHDYSKMHLAVTIYKYKSWNNSVQINQICEDHCWTTNDKYRKCRYHIKMILENVQFTQKIRIPETTRNFNGH